MTKPLNPLHRLVVALLAAVLCTLATGCFAPHAQMVREAQDAFSEGAELENTRKFDPARQLDPSAFSGPTDRYAAARGIIEQVLAEAEGDLRRDDLYATALTVHALSSWRLGDTASAEASAKQVRDLVAATEPGTRVWPRDAAVCKALPQLIKVDALGDTVEGLPTGVDAATFETQVMQYVPKVHQELQAAGEELEDGHPLQIYFALADLELTYVVFQGLTAKMTREARRPGHVERYQSMRTDGLKRLQALKANDRFDSETQTAIGTHLDRYTRDLHQTISTGDPEPTDG